MFCVIPRGHAPEDRGWPWQAARGVVYILGSFQSQEDYQNFLDSVEREWQSGEIPRRAGVWFTFRYRHGCLIAVNPLLLSADFAAGVGLVIALAALEAALHRRFDRRAWPGHCTACGYNLAGNTSGTCPECGTPTAQRATTEP